MPKGLPKSLKRAGQRNTFPSATPTNEGAVKQGVAVADCTPAADGTEAGTQLNALLESLRDAGIIAPSA